MEIIFRSKTVLSKVVVTMPFVDRIHTLNALENGGLFSDFSKYWTCLHRHNATKYCFENRQLLTKTTSKVVYFIGLRYWSNEH